MQGFLNAADGLKHWSAGAFVALIILAMLTDTLVWGGRLRRAEKERDRWQAMSLELLGVTDRMTGAAETVNEILDKRLPETGASIATVVKVATTTPDGAPQEPSKGGGLREVARAAGEAALRRLRES